EFWEHIIAFCQRALSSFTLGKSLAAQHAHQLGGGLVLKPLPRLLTPRQLGSQQYNYGPGDHPPRFHRATTSVWTNRLAARMPPARLAAALRSPTLLILHVVRRRLLGATGPRHRTG